MADHLDKFDRIAKAIGNTCMIYGDINTALSHLVLHLSYCISPKVQEGKTMNVVHLIVAHMDEREVVAVAKSLASELMHPSSPELYPKLEKLLNHIDNDVRVERNRYVHDWWDADEHEIIRTKPGPKVIRPQSRQYQLAAYTERRYDSIEQVELFVEHLKIVWEDVVRLDDHLAWLLSEIEGQPSGSPQPLPQEWKSSSHHGWRGVDTPVLPPRSSEA